MNYILQLNSFGDFVTQFPQPSKALAVYYALLHINNKCRWRRDFTVANLTLQSFCSISRSDLHKMRKVLIKNGLIEYHKGHGSQAGTYRIVCLYETQSGTQVDTQSGTQVDTQSGTQVDTQSGTQVDTQVDTQSGTQVDTQSGTQVDTQSGTQVDTFMEHNWNTLTKYKHKYKEKGKKEKETKKDFTSSLEVQEISKGYEWSKRKEAYNDLGKTSNGKIIELDESKFLYGS